MEDTKNFTIQVLNFLEILIPYVTVLAVFWKVIDSILKYANDGRDTRTRELIAQATQPLENDLRELTKSIWALSDKIEKM